MSNIVCAKCRNVNSDETDSLETSVSKCEKWLNEKCSISDGDSASISSCSHATSEDYNESLVENNDNQLVCAEKQEYVQDLLNTTLQQHGRNDFGDVKIVRSKHVLVGHKTIIKGPIYLTHTTTTFKQDNTVNQIFLDPSTHTAKGTLKRPIRLVPRRDWLAQPPIQKTPLEGPTKYVVISHTASEEGFNQADNVHLIRRIQFYHIESLKWDDIAYNFLIGSDGYIYEGRGWECKGAFAFDFNTRSIGISFVGCFLDHLPPESALLAAQNLIDEGVKLGYIQEDYTLLGHCQCSATQSPGRKLYEEIKTWKGWREVTPQDSVYTS